MKMMGECAWQVRQGDACCAGCRTFLCEIVNRHALSIFSSSKPCVCCKCAACCQALQHRPAPALGDLPVPAMLPFLPACVLVSPHFAALPRSPYSGCKVQKPLWAMYLVCAHPLNAMACAFPHAVGMVATTEQVRRTKLTCIFNAQNQSAFPYNDSIHVPVQVIPDPAHCLEAGCGRPGG